MSRSRWFPSAYAVVLAAAVLSPAAASAQRATVKGQVVDTRSGQPVPYALVHLDDERVTAVADSTGSFEVKRVSPGSRAIWADAPGYSMAMGTVDVVPGTTVEVTLELVSNPVQLAALNVTTSRFERRARGYAGSVRVFRERDLADMWYSNVRQMVESRAGVRPVLCPGGGGWMECTWQRGSAYQSLVFIDEVRWTGGLDRLADYSPREVSRVEVFGAGREIHVYTRQFMNWASRRPFVPTPLGLGF
jgi:hypothetical protein